ncbi:hypothetical protein KQH65_11640 [archaeon]|nr:hypothetical protein [archaeon]
MNTKENATKEIIHFLHSDEETLLLTGTHQNVKHTLALECVLSFYPSSTLLFRTGNRNFEDFLSPVIKINQRFKSGFPYKLMNNHVLYLDTVNPASWSKTPTSIDVAIVYPINALNEIEGDRVVNDIIRRKAKKTLLVSCTDNKTYDWTEQYQPTKVVYDAEAERPSYHQEMLKITDKKNAPFFVHNLPQYAKSTPHEYLVKILCRNCGSTRWARMNTPFTGKTAMREANFGELEAICLKCGYRATDNYNWSR